MYSGIISNKTPDHHLDDQALIFFREEPSWEPPEHPEESPQERDKLRGICLTPTSVFM